MLWPKLAKGGIVIFDDYGFIGCEVTKLVNETSMNKDNNSSIISMDTP